MICEGPWIIVRNAYAFFFNMTFGGQCGDQWLRVWALSCACLVYLQSIPPGKKGKGSHSLLAVWAMGVRVPLYLGHS